MNQHQHWKWLLRQLPDWVDQGLIDPQQADGIRGLAPASQAGQASLAARILIGISALLIGLGVISFFAFNWQNMPKILKLLLVFGAFLGAHLTGIWMRSRPRQAHRTRQIEFCHLLGTLLFGAAIMLIAQIYHIDEHFPNGILLWALGAGLMAWVLFSTPQMLLFGVLTVLWQAYERGFDLPQLWGVGLAAAVMIPFALCKKHWFAVAITTATLAAILPLQLSFFRFGVMVSLMFVGVMGQGMALLIRRSNYTACARPPEILGGSLYFIALIAFTYEWGISSGLLKAYQARIFVELLVPVVLAMANVVLWSAWLFPVRTLVQRWTRTGEKYRFMPFIGFLMALALWLTGCFAGADTDTRDILAAIGMIGFNLLAVVHGLWMILAGTRQGRIGVSFMGCLLVVIVILSRFAAYADNLLIRSAAFILAGVFVLTIALKTSRVKQKQEVPDHG